MPRSKSKLRRRRGAFGGIASAAAITVVAGAAVCSASEISIHFYDTNTAVDTLGPAGAGAARVAGQWNDINNTSSFTGSGIALSNTTGAATGALLSYSAGSIGNWINSGSPLTYTGEAYWPTATTTAEDSQLYEGSLTTTQTLTPDTVSLSSIPYASYDLYVYFQGSENNSAIWQLHDSATGLSYYVDGDQHAGGYEDSHLTGYSLATGTSVGTATYANYAVFHETANATTLTLAEANNSGDGAGLYGIQIVQTPEPTSLSCAFAGCAAVMLRRRRKPRST